MASDDPPTEFRIFRKGWNETTKGDALFDDLAAKMVMDEYKRHGVDRSIDLEHLSLDRESPNYDPDSRGAFNLEVRNGELWAVNVKWAPDGERRLRAKTQRYISPFFFLGAKSRRVTSVYNVAICSTPATHDAPALVAAVAANANAKHALASLTLSLGADMDALKKKLAEMMGLAEDVSDEDLVAAVAALQDDDKGEENADDPKDDDKDKPKKEVEAADDTDEEKALSALPPKVQARLRAKIDSAERNDKRLKALEEKTNKSEVETLLAANADRFSLKQEKWLRSQSAETVREFLAHSDPVSKPARKEPVVNLEDIDSIQATDADRQIAKATGESIETVLEGRKRDLKKKQQQGLRLAK